LTATLDMGHAARAILRPDGKPIQAGEIRQGDAVTISTAVDGNRPGDFVLDTRNRKARRAAAAKARAGR
jgi:hypothetical protein